MILQFVIYHTCVVALAVHHDKKTSCQGCKKVEFCKIDKQIFWKSFHHRYIFHDTNIRRMHYNVLIRFPLRNLKSFHWTWVLEVLSLDLQDVRKVFADSVPNSVGKISSCSNCLYFLNVLILLKLSFRLSVFGFARSLACFGFFWIFCISTIIWLLWIFWVLLFSAIFGVI